MDLLTNERLWNSVLRTPPVKWMLKTALTVCPKCKLTPLKTALDNYSGKKHSFCSSCSVYSMVIGFWIGFIQHALGVEKSRVANLFADSYVRRAVNSIVYGFAEFGFNRPIQVRSPFLVVWNFTYKCNLKCKHCYSDSGNVSKTELSTEEAMAVVDQVADFGVTSLAFSGGEPLMRKDFFEVARHAVDAGLYVSLATNGTLLTEENVRKLKDIGVHYVEVSVDGANAKTHDFFRGKTGAFEQTMQGLKNCMNKNICTCIAITGTKNNLKEIPAVLEMAENMGIDRFTLFNFIPTGRGKEIVAADPSPQEREQLLRFFNTKLSEDHKIAILSTTPQLARVALQNCSPTQEDIIMPLAHMEATKINKRAKALADFIGGCGAGRLYCAISPEGDVQPCVFMPLVVGNLKTERLEDIWLNSKVFKDLRNRENLKGRCGKCEYKFVCGGCRARAFAYHDDYLMSDPGCIKKLSEGD
ncbi:MAG: radical SAM/SPASM domain-containing protein [Candidatus Bathyarchaeum sp.]|nr:MAG: radical SAM/SPASM domain-containing protein [Candidatus Bathyarchaeum sp.]